MGVASVLLAVGIFVGSLILVALARQPLRLERRTDYLHAARLTLVGCVCATVGGILMGGS